MKTWWRVARAAAGALLTLSVPLAAEPETPVARFPDTPAVRDDSGIAARPAPAPEHPISSLDQPSQHPATTSDAGRSWATRAARRWYDKGQRREEHRDVAGALDAYSRAIRTDSTFGPAFLAMARLRERIDDYPEAERLYASAIALNGFAAEALARRAALRRELGRDAEALQDLEAAVQAAPETPEYLERLARWYVADHNWSAALAANRRLETVLGKTGDTARAAQVHLQVLALAVLAGETDPVSAGRESPSWVRRSLAEISSH